MSWRIERAGFRSRYTKTFGSLDDKQAARRHLGDRAAAAGAVT